MTTPEHDQRGQQVLEWLATAVLILLVVGMFVFYGFNDVGKAMVEQSRFMQNRTIPPLHAGAICTRCTAAK